MHVEKSVKVVPGGVRVEGKGRYCLNIFYSYMNLSKHKFVKVQRKWNI